MRRQYKKYQNTASTVEYIPVGTFWIPGWVPPRGPQGEQGIHFYKEQYKQRMRRIVEISELSFSEVSASRRLQNWHVIERGRFRWFGAYSRAFSVVRRMLTAVIYIP